MTIKANVSFAHTADRLLKDVEFDVLPRVDEDLAIVPSGKGGHQRIDRVARVRHYITDAGHHIDIVVDRR